MIIVFLDNDDVCYSLRLWLLLLHFFLLFWFCHGCLFWGRWIVCVRLTRLISIMVNDLPLAIHSVVIPVNFLTCNFCGRSGCIFWLFYFLFDRSNLSFSLFLLLWLGWRKLRLVFERVVVNRVFEILCVTKVNLKEANKGRLKAKYGSTYDFKVLVLVNEDVFWLQVTVHYIMIEALLEAFDDRSSKKYTNIMRKFAF